MSFLLIHPYIFWHSYNKDLVVCSGKTSLQLTCQFHDFAIQIVNYLLCHYTGGNRTMVAAATAADGEHISIFPLVCRNKARSVSFSAPDIVCQRKKTCNHR